jgi:hypothetical protein
MSSISVWGGNRRCNDEAAHFFLQAAASFHYFTPHCPLKKSIHIFRLGKNQSQQTLASDFSKLSQQGVICRMLMVVSFKNNNLCHVASEFRGPE